MRTFGDEKLVHGLRVGELWPIRHVTHTDSFPGHLDLQPRNIFRDIPRMILITLKFYMTMVLMTHSGRCCNSFALDLQQMSLLCDIHLTTPSSPVQPDKRPPRMVSRQLYNSLGTLCLVAIHTYFWFFLAAYPPGLASVPGCVVFHRHYLYTMANALQKPQSIL